MCAGRPRRPKLSQAGGCMPTAVARCARYSCWSGTSPMLSVKTPHPLSRREAEIAAITSFGLLHRIFTPVSWAGPQPAARPGFQTTAVPVVSGRDRLRPREARRPGGGRSVRPCAGPGHRGNREEAGAAWAEVWAGTCCGLHTGLPWGRGARSHEAHALYRVRPRLRSMHVFVGHIAAGVTDLP